MKRAKQPITDFMLLVNREKDNKIHPATFQSLSYMDTAFVAFAPFYSHSVMPAEQARGCSDCHQNYGGSLPAIEEYNQKAPSPSPPGTIRTAP